MNAAPQTNPLLEKSYRIPFDRIKAEHVEPAMAQLLVEAKAKRDAYVSNSAPRTYANTMTAFEDIVEDLSQTMGIARHLEGVASTPALRAAVTAVLPKYAAFTASIPLDKKIYARIKEFAATPEAQSLTGARKRFLTLTLDEFRRSGAELGDADKDKLRAMSVEMSKLRKQFSDNVLDATNAFEIVIKEDTLLAGLPESARAAARESAKRKGVEGWRFTLQEPSFRAVMTNLDDAGIRERVYRAYNTRAASGSRDNVPIMKRILELRRERARLLGYKNYADLITEDRMAKNGAPRARIPLRRSTPRRARSMRRRPPRSWPSGAPWKAPTRRRSRRGTSSTTPRRCAKRATTSTRKPRAPTSPWRACRRACSNWCTASTASP